MIPALENFSQDIGMSLGLFGLIIAWTVFWKLVGMWYSARNKQPIWFVAIAIFNTIGILPILYVFIFRNLKEENTSSTKKSQKNKPSKKKTVQRKLSKKKNSKKKTKKKSTSKKSK